MAALAQTFGLEHLSLAGLPLPITIRLPQPITDDELIAFSHQNRPYRIEQNAAGELEIMSPVGFAGGQRELFVMMRLGQWEEEHGGICVSCDTGFTLSDGSVRSPDASWISETAASRLTSDQERRFAPLCPEFLIEILSESDRKPTLEAKMQTWIAHGAQLAWMIDPFARTVSIYRPARQAETLTGPGVVTADIVVPGFTLDMTRLWAK